MRQSAQAFTCRVEHRFPVAVVRLAGPLDTGTAVQVRAELFGCLADEPTALVLDLADLTAAEDLAVALFDLVAERAARWPGTVVLLCAPRPDLDAALSRGSGGPRIPVCPGLSQALEVAQARPLPPRVREVYLPSREAPQHARTVVARTCAAWGVRAAIPAAQAIVSELVANAVVHARTVLEFSVALRGRAIQVSVRDGDSHAVEPRMPDHGAEGGRGLLVVAGLAEDWGCLRTRDGKVVWASIPA
jgi:hypothetical protein